MIPTRQVFLVALFLWGAAILQGRVAHAISIRGAQPDLPLIVLSGSALLIGSVRGTVLGCWAGLLAGALSPSAYGSYFASRIIVGAFAGSIGSNLIRDNLLVPPLMTLAATLLAEVVCVLMAPGLALHHVHRWLILVGGELLYNTLLALPIYFLLRACHIGRLREDPFGHLL